MQTRNITFKLPLELLRKAKTYAAEHDTTVNTLVRTLLEEKLTRSGQYQAAAARFLALSSRGPLFTSDPGAIRREDLYERR